MEPEKSPLEQRKDEFKIRYKALIDELHIDFLSTPQYVPAGNGAWVMVIHTELVDTTDVSVPSPIQL